MKNKQEKILQRPSKPIEPQKSYNKRTEIYTFSSYNEGWDNENEEEDYDIEDVTFTVNDLLDLLKDHNANDVFFELDPCCDRRDGPHWANLTLFKLENKINENYESEMKSFERKNKKYEKDLVKYNEQQAELDWKKNNKEIKDLENKLKILKKNK